MSRRDPNQRPFNVQCPTCLASRGEPCRTLGTRRVTDNHMARISRSYASRVSTDGGPS